MVFYKKRYILCKYTPARDYVPQYTQEWGGDSLLDNTTKKVCTSCFYVDTNLADAQEEFVTTFSSLLKRKLVLYDEVIFLCIGTDRATGDCLGPLIGHRLRDTLAPPFQIYGTLDAPVHAKNISTTIQTIYDNHKSPLVIAIDASLGKFDNVGFVTLGEGSLKPGAGVKKVLPAVGDIYITGIVNFGGVMEILTLQNTRLSVVMKMAELISSGIECAIDPLRAQRA